MVSTVAQLVALVGAVVGLALIAGAGGAVLGASLAVLYIALAAEVR